MNLAGFQKKVLKTGLYKTIQWYLTNREWTASIFNTDQYHEWLKLNYTDISTSPLSL